MKVDPKSLKYKNITISGLPGAGSSTLGRGLVEKLGWEYFGGGDFMRAYAVEKGLFDKGVPVHHDASVYDDQFDKKVDYGVRERLEKETGVIFDAWLSGFMAQKVKGVLKILVYCGNDDLRVDRLVNRDGVSVEEAKRHIFEREEKNLKKWTRMYEKEWGEWIDKEYQDLRRDGCFDFYNPKLYEVAIDTYTSDREASLKKVLKALEFKEI